MFLSCQWKLCILSQGKKQTNKQTNIGPRIGSSIRWVSQGAERKTAREKDLKRERLEEARSKASICYFLMAVLSLSTGIQPGIIFFFMEI